MRHLIITLASLTAFLSACSFNPHTRVRLPDELPDRYVESNEKDHAKEIRSSGDGRWWKRFDDPQLNRLMEAMFEKNLQIEQAFARLQQARASVISVRSARFPSVNAEGEAGRTMEPSFAGDYTGDNYRLAGAASFEIDLWGKLEARARAAAKKSDATYEELRTLYLGLSAQLADLYYLAVEQREQLALSNETIASFEETLTNVEERYRLGVVPAVDVYQARQSLSAAQAARHLFAANLATSEHAVAVLLGRYPASDEAGQLAELPTMPEAFPTGLPSELVGRRPDLKALLRQIEAADADVAAAIADRFPSLNLIGTYGTTSRDFATGLIEGDFWNYLGNITLPIFDAGRRRAEVQRRREVIRERVAAYQQAVLVAFREVEDALARNRETELRLSSLRETEKATRATLRLSLDRYYQGLTDYLPVLNAQRSHFDARSRLLAARRELMSARIELARALGGDWMADAITKRYAKQDDKP